MSCLNLGNVSDYFERAHATQLAHHSPAQTEHKQQRLRGMSSDANPMIRGAVAGNPMAPLDVLTYLSYDESSYVRGWVARNPALTEDLLSAFRLYDPDSSIQIFAGFRQHYHK